MDELGFMYTYTPVHQPQYNGIEELIGIGTQKVRQMRLDKVQNNLSIDLHEIPKPQSYEK